jgi:Cohesin domain/CARDB
VKSVKKETLLVLCLIISIASVSLPFGVVNANPETTVFVHDPVTQGDVSSAAIGQTFTVEVRVSDVVNLVGFEFYMKWNTTLLEFVSAKEGPFLNSTGAYQSFFSTKVPGSPSWPDDEIYVVDVLYGGTLSTSASGSGVLAKITFKALDDGIGTLDLHDSILTEFDPFTPRPIPHTSADGYFAFPLPIAFVDPEEVLGVAPGESFNITVAVIDIVKAYNLTFKLGWDKTKLNATAILEEPFLSSQGATSFHSSIDQDNGVLYVNNTLTGEPLTGVSGSGVLAKITFLVEARGSTDLTLFDVRLFMQDGSVSPAAVESSTFTNTQRDVAITDGSLSTSSVSKGQAVGITVVVKNKGVEDETFTVKFEYSGQSITSLPVTNLVPDDTQTLTYQWDTSNVEAGTYTVKATIVETIPGEVNRADNTRTLGDITITGGGGGIDMTLLIVGAVIAIVVVVAVVVFLFLRRRK